MLYMAGSCIVEVKTSELEKLEDLISDFKKEKDSKKKHIIYLKLIEESLKLVKKIATGIGTFSGSVPKDDLIQVGAIGALKAIDTYETEERGSFKTYATKFIKGKILQYLRDKSNIVKPPRETHANISLVKRASEELYEINGSTPTAEDIAKYTNLPIDKVIEILNIEAIRNIVSLDQKLFSDDGGETLLDRISGFDDNDYQKSYENKKIIEFALNKLPKQEREVIFKYYIEGMTKKDVAVSMNISATQVARIIKRALNKMYIIITREIKEEI